MPIKLLKVKKRKIDILLVTLTETKTGLHTALKSINNMDVFYIVAEAYEENPQSAFIKPWRNLWPNVEKNYGELNIIELTRMW